MLPQIDLLQQRVHLRAALALVHEPLEQREMIKQHLRRHTRIHAEILRQVAQPGTMRGDIGKDVLPIEGDLSLVHGLQRGNGAHERRLAGAIGAKQPIEAGGNIQGDAAQCAHAVGVGARDLAQAEASGS